MRCHILPFAKSDTKIRIMFEDEAGFGRISDPADCWAPNGVRPVVSCHHIREYEYAYGVVDPVDGEKFFLVLPNSNTECMNIFLREVSAAFSEDYILIALDNAVWHKSKALEIPENIRLFYLPPRTPEMNPIEPIWKEIRKRGFKNKIFATLEKVLQKLCDTCNSLSKECVKSITGRDWILSMF
jgi:Transposase and inactivated derivatives